MNDPLLDRLLVAVGTQYLVDAEIGRGGMAVVYRATDLRLNRRVAIKVLPPELAFNADVRERFLREAQTAAQLSHPSIVPIYTVDEREGIVYFVMALVDGESLAERLVREPRLPISEARRLLAGVADALAYAHSQGVVHRDVKPDNIMLDRATGRPMVTDFGIARAAQGDTRLTVTGVAIGTPAYMSPEQALGEDVDHRTDIFSLGAVLHEMATGKKAFTGASRASLIGAIMSTEPPPISSIQPMTPPALDHVVRRCLAKDPDERWQSAADVASELRWVAESGSQAGAPATVVSRRKSRERIAWIGFACAALLAAIFAIAYLARSPKLSPVMRLEVVPRRGERLNFNLRAFAISPDGTRLAYVVSKGATTELRLRSLDSGESAAIPGTEGAQHPFFSPDGKWIAFNGGVKLKKVAVSGGSPVTLGEAVGFRGGVWAEDGRIYYVPNQYVPVARVPSTGGPPENVTRIRTAEGEQQHRWPELLPGGRVLLYVVGSGGDWDDATIVAERLDTGERKVLVKGGTFPRYLPTGQLVFARAGALYAVAFDARSLAVEGSPVEVAKDVFIDTSGFAQMDVSRTGMLVTAPHDSIAGDLMLSWVDRAGRTEVLNLPRQPYSNLAISPDGTRVALGIGNAIGVLNLGRVALAKLSLGARAEYPVWSGDGRRLYFGLEKGEHYQVFWKAADDSGSEQLVFASSSSEAPLQMSADDARMLTFRTPPDGQNELLLRDVSRGAAGKEPKRLVKSPFLADSGATLDPGGRLVAYQAQEQGRPEIYVRPTSGEDRKWQVSSDGGTYPLWSSDGKEIFYLCGMKFMAVSVETQGEEFHAGTPRALFESHEIYYYDVARDGRRFFVAENPNPGMSSHLDVVVNWFSEVKRKVQESKGP